MLKSDEICNFNRAEINGGLGKFIYDCCSKHGDKIFQFCADTKKSETFVTYRDKSVRLAIEMRNRGIGRGDVVMSCSPNTLDSHVFLAATFYLGAAATALDPTLSNRDCAHMIGLVKPKLIFVHEESVALLESALEISELEDVLLVVYGKSIKYPQFSEFLKESSKESNFKPVHIDDPFETCWILFSSGTTGLAKGICLNHIGFCFAAKLTERFMVNPTVQIYSTTLYWASAAIFYLNQMLTGSKRILRRATDAKTLLETIAEYKITSLFTAPFYGYKIADLGDLHGYDLSSFEQLLFGGGPMSVELIQLLRKRLLNTVCTLGYGMTETNGPIVVFSKHNRDLWMKYPNSCGQLVPGLVAKFVDLETEEVLGPNKTGEFRVKFEYGMNGYLGRDASLDYDSDGFFKSGDVGYYNDDGCIFIIDRIKDMFKYLSWHIVPASLEVIIMEHEAVHEVVVFGLPHERDGEVPAAAISVKPGYNVTASEIERFVAERVADRQRLRGGVHIFGEIPRTPTGKLLRKYTRDIVLAQRKH